MLEETVRDAVERTDESSPPDSAREVVRVYSESPKRQPIVRYYEYNQQNGSEKK